MRLLIVAGLLLCGSAQGADPKLMREVAAVRAELARSRAALRQYTWTEHTEVLVKKKINSSSAALCRYNGSGEVTRTPVSAAKDKDTSSAISNNPAVRSQADMRDYIERAVTRIHLYVPPKPEQIDYLLQNGYASLGPSEAGKSEVRFTNYFQRGDSLVFTYDSVSKVLLRIMITSALGSPKDPVTLEAIFETLPDGVNHLSSAVLNATSRKVQVKMRNVMYQKAAN